MTTSPSQEQDSLSAELERLQEERGRLAETAMAQADATAVITALGEARRHLETKVRQLEEQVTELTGALEKTASDTREESGFLASMSHEIRTPMNGVIGMTELVLDTDLTTEQRDYVELIKASADSLLDLLNDIVDFSRIEAGELDLETVPFSLHDAVGETMRALAQTAGEKGLQLACQIEPEVPDRLQGDPGRLQQILVTLVENAVKFTKRGSVVVGAQIASQGEDRVQLHFWVSDTGVGIPRERQQQVFQAFSETARSTTRQYSGSGLSLAIAARLVHAMQGRIWFESESGVGSIIQFTACFACGQSPERP